MSRQHFETQAALTAALIAWQDASWVRQGKPQEWELRVVRTELDPDNWLLRVDVQGEAELFLATLPAAAIIEFKEFH